MTFGLQPAVDTDPGLGPATDRASLKRAVIRTAVAAAVLYLFFIIFWPSLSIHTVGLIASDEWAFWDPVLCVRD